MDSRLRIGDLVCLRVDNSRYGPVIEILPPAGGQTRYRVFHAAGEIREYYEDQLLPFVVCNNEPTVMEMLTNDALALDANTFRARLTASRLNHPWIDQLYSLHAARIRFVPFQLKPLLRFLRAEQPRLLIADEVGVGKTIEAGLILRELQSRQQVGNVLIVCPKALVSKWRTEMLRFDEDFQPLNSETLRYCLRETHLDGVWPERFSRAIVHLELLRSGINPDDNPKRTDQPGLLSLNPPPQFSLTIVDEAHHLRNPNTRSHKLARFLCDASEAVVFLSATPVHLGSENLFTLLQLLRPDIFIDASVFSEMLEQNQYLNTAVRAIRHREPRGDWQSVALDSLQHAADTVWGSQTLQHDPRFSVWLDRLQSPQELDDNERIRCLRDLEDVHTLAHVMNRTRRRDIGRFTIREPHTVSVPFSPAQEHLYQELIEFRRRMLRQKHDEVVVRLIIDTLERQASSCLPGLVPLLDRFLQTGRFAANELTDDDEIADLERMLPPTLVPQAEKIRQLAAALPPSDPKLDRLIDIAETTQETGGPGKLLVFSYFLHTLDYLHEQLTRTQFRTATITGRTSDEDREHLRQRFRLPHAHPNAIDILLSSEVGCEGLDYEFCDRLVNYDIPWNPMRIEQRIGRIDRFGQMSPKVLIYNFITPGTVEERIFFRCFERIGIFQNTVGDLEEILSITMQDLTRAALDPNLTADQQDEVAQQKTDNLIRVAEEQRRLTNDEDSLLGFERVFGEEIDELINEGRFVAPADLAQMIDRYLQHSNLGGRLTPDATEPKLQRLRLNREARTFLGETVRKDEIRNRTSAAFLRWLDGNEPNLALTVDQETALERRDLTFVTPVHPLTRAATRYWGAIETPLVACLSLETDLVPPGTYLFACDLWEKIAIAPEVQLINYVWDIDRQRPCDDVLNRLLLALSDPSLEAAHLTIPNGTLRAAETEVNDMAHQRRVEALEQLRDRNGVMAKRRVASLNGYYGNRLERLRHDIEIAQDARILVMRRSELDRVQREFEQRKVEIEARLAADILSNRVATGVLIVRKAQE